MNIMYVAPAYHPNQTPIVKGWIENGDKVKFICQYHMNIEDHVYTEAIDLGYSKVYYALERIYRLMGKSANAAYPEYFSDKCGFPPKRKIREVFDEFRPDVVIVRERNFYSMRVYAMCRRRHIPCLLYNQTPLYDAEPPRNDIPHRIVKSLCPQIRYTPVYGNPKTGYLDEKAHYIPFVTEPVMSPEEREKYCREKRKNDTRVNILCVGKYEERKNHLMMADMVRRLREHADVRLTIVGNATTNYHYEYLEKLRTYVTDNGLEDIVDIHVNVEHDRMDEFYRTADMFVIPSTAEFASIAQLEAMAYSLPVVASDTNGTSCYIEDGVNGYIFRDMDRNDLQEKLVHMVSDRVLLQLMGQESYRLVCENHSFSRYREEILRLVNNE